MKTLFRQPKQTLYISFGLFFVALALVGILPTKKVYADNKVPTSSLVWVDVAKSAAVSSNNVRFEALGYVCLNNDKWFTGSGNSVAVNGDAQPQNKDVNTKTYVSYTFPQVPVDGSPNQWCQGSSKGNMASYAWVTRYSSGNNYALIQLPCYGNKDAATDPKTQVVISSMYNNGDPGCIWMGHINSSGIVATNEIIKPQIKEIKVDTTKANAGGTNDEEDDADTKDNCLIQSWAFKWAACPILEYIIGDTTNTTETNGLLGYMQSKMTTWLVGDADTFNTANGKAGASYYKAWNSFRTIAVSLIIIAGIVMVVAQAVGSSVIDAYAVRKIAPRLIAYAIIMTLSWWLLKWLYQFFDNLTVWIASIISAPFSDLKAAPLDGTAMFSSALAVIAAVAAINPPIVFTYVLTFLTAVFVAWLILALRQMLLIFLLLIAPLAIASFILPGTRKLGDFWWNSTVTLLLMGPAIGAAIVFGQIIPNIFVTPANANTFDKFGVIRLGAPFIGYASTAFIAARLGGLAGTITGMANDKAKGVFDRVSNKRGEMRAKRFNDMAKGQAWSNNNVVGKGLNKFTRGAAIAGSVAANKPSALFNKTSYQNGGIFSSRADQAARAQAGELQKDPRWGAIQNHDGALRAATYSDDRTAIAEMTKRYQSQHSDWTAERARQEAEKDVQAFHASGLERSAGMQYAAATGLAATGTGIDDYMDQAAIISRVAGGNDARLSSLAGDMNFTDKSGKRHADLAAGYGNVRESAEKYADYQRNLAIAQSSTADEATRRTARAKVVDYENLINQHGVDAARGASIHDLAGDKAATHKNTARVLNQALERHISTLNDRTASKDARDKAAVEVGNIVAQMNNMKGSVPMFAAASNAAAMHEHGLRSADENIQRVNSMAQRTIKQEVEIRDNTGKVVGMQSHDVANPNYNETLARTMREQVSPRSDPNDPRNYGQAA
ncbi:MAG TPA: hypothetical protein VJ843_05920 [Candidatus Saccharimonadales bacterium]|nr:hypothetical protein [Candidatus Saccharimonadales bacterium]